jgi:hypothetical protein
MQRLLRFLEARRMKKTLLYIAIAVILGLSLTIVPLITLAEIKTGDTYVMPQSLSGQLEKLEGSHANMTSSNATDVEVLGVSFVIALVVYVVFKPRRPHRDRSVITLPYHF